MCKQEPALCPETFRQAGPCTSGGKSRGAGTWLNGGQEARRPGARAITAESCHLQDTVQKQVRGAFIVLS